MNHSNLHLNSKVSENVQEKRQLAVCEKNAHITDGSYSGTPGSNSSIVTVFSNYLLTSSDQGKDTNICTQVITCLARKVTLISSGTRVNNHPPHPSMTFLSETKLTFIFPS